jgi:hypothetical protein
MVLKEITKKQNNNIHEKFPSFIKFVSHFNYNNLDTEQSNVVYVDIYSLHADSKETIIKVLDQLYTKFVVGQRLQYVVVAADAKIFDILQHLRKEYGYALSWLLPFLGDWHTLFNYQKVFTKIYWDAGLLQLAQASGHRAETLKSLANATNFKRSHAFIISCFEAIYRSFINSFIDILDPDIYHVMNSVL